MLTRQFKRIIIVSLMALAIIFGAAAVTQTASAATVNGKITVDGNLKDWKDVPENKSTDGAIKWWKTAQDSQGNLYIAFTGTASTQWYGDYNWKWIGFSQNGNNYGFQVTNEESTTGGKLAIVNMANGNTAGDYFVEMEIPASYVANNNYSISLANTNVARSDVSTLSGKDVTPQKDGKYHGINIDGDFDDWDAVKKYDAACPNKDHPNCLEKVAMVFDGDYVYLYVKDAPGYTAAGAGSHSNGRFEIETDLGRKLMLHFNNDGTVTSSKAKGITSRHVGSEWEVRIPADQLPHYNKTLNFGLYQADNSDFEPIVKDVANLNGKENGNKFNGITYDGQYGDWEDYPSTEIEYATAGTQNDMVDGEAAMYRDGKKIYGHVLTEMPAHLNEHGGEFLQAVTIRVNKAGDKEFYPRFITVDENGNINWDPSFNFSGTREFYIVDSQGWASAKTLDDLESGKYGNAVFGKMMVTANGSSRDECEYYIDSDQLAKKFNMDEQSIQYVDSQYGRIGQQWVGTTGASTGPWIGVLLCLLITGGVIYCNNRRRPDKKDDR